LLATEQNTNRRLVFGRRECGVLVSKKTESKKLQCPFKNGVVCWQTYFSKKITEKETRGPGKRLG